MQETTNPLWLYRFCKAERALEIFNTNTLTLVKPAKWKDPFENFISKISFQDKSKKLNRIEYLDHVFGLCFTTERESNIMWDAYAPFANGIRLKFDVPELMKQIKQSKLFSEEAFHFRQVEYKTYQEMNGMLKDKSKLIALYKDPASAKLLDFLFQKRKEYRFECEHRLIFDANIDKKYIGEKMIQLNIDPLPLIKSISFDPMMDDKTIEKYKNHFKSLGMNSKELKSSKLYKFKVERVIKLD